MQQNDVAQQVAQLLANTSVTFACVAYSTPVKLAAKNKHLTVQKHTVANVQLFANINAATSVYANAVKRSAATHTTNSPAAVAEFAAQSNYYEHTDCYSIVQHKNNSNLYLYCIYNRARSSYTIDGAPASRQDVAALLTPSAAEQLLHSNNVVHNAAHNITHSVIVRTIALSNIKQIRARRQQLTF